MKNNSWYTVVTGASSGIGYETAKALAKKGKNLIIVARNQENLQRLKMEISQENSTVDVIVKSVDLSIISNAHQLYNELKEYPIETWINNAGFGDYSSVANQDLKKIETMLNLNVVALVVLSTLFVNDYYDKENAQLINISSAGGYVIVPNAITYCASKFFVNTFTEGLARELQESNGKLQVKVLAPAATKTNFGMVANNQEQYDYDKMFGTFHSAKQMAGFLMELYDSHFSVGAIDRETFKFILQNPQFAYAGSSTHNQKKNL